MIKYAKQLEVPMKTQQLFNEYLMDYQEANDVERQIFSFIAKADLESLEKEKAFITGKILEYQQHRQNIIFLKNFSSRVKLYYWQMELSQMELILIQEQIKGIIFFVDNETDVHYASMKLQARDKSIFDREKDAFMDFKSESEKSHTINGNTSFRGKHLFNNAKEAYQQGKATNKLLIKK